MLSNLKVSETSAHHEECFTVRFETASSVARELYNELASKYDEVTKDWDFPVSACREVAWLGL